MSLTQRPVSEDKQHSQEADYHTPVEIRTRNPSKRRAADPRPRPLGHWDRPPTVNSS